VVVRGVSPVEEGSLWWKGFVKRVGLSRDRVKSWGVMMIIVDNQQDKTMWQAWKERSQS